MKVLGFYLIFLLVETFEDYLDMGDNLSRGIGLLIILQFVFHYATNLSSIRPL